MDLFRGIAFLIFGLIAGVVGYQIGVSQNIAATVPAAATAVPAYYWYGPHMFGFGFLGFLFPILFFFLFIALVSAAVRGGRGWSSYGHDARRARFEEMHRELHGDTPRGGTSSPTT